VKRLALALALAFVSLPAAAQDAARGKLLYETHCGGCHYERVHERDRNKTTVHSLAELRDQVARRAAQTGRPFTLEDLADIAEYLDRSHYRFAR
jgi:mono/diheme cytochrome c family protein